MKIVLRLPEKSPMLNELLRMHWAKRSKIAKAFAWHVMLALLELPKTQKQWVDEHKPFNRCRISVVRYARYTASLPDQDGIIGGFKPVLDALTVQNRRNKLGLGIIRDDSQDCVEWVGAKGVYGHNGSEITLDLMVSNGQQ